MTTLRDQNQGITVNIILSNEDRSRIIEMAWEDRTPFEAIQDQFGLDEAAVIALMREQMNKSSFRMWRKRMHGRTTKHQAFGVNKKEYNVPIDETLQD